MSSRDPGDASPPLATAPLEVRELVVGFIPILCSVPLLYAHAGGFFSRSGLSVELRPAPGWSGIKELLVHGKIDAAHMLTPMPLACAAGIDGMPADLQLCLIQNINGQVLTLSTRHREAKGPADLRGLTLGVPYLYSMQYYLLCHYLAQGGVDPLREVRIIEVVPPQMPTYLAKGWLDGFFGPEPYPQLAVSRGVGFLFLLSREIWSGHPCCGLATRSQLLATAPNTVQALLGSVIAAQHALHTADRETRDAIAQSVTGPGYLNVRDPRFIVQALVGEFPDGRGGSIKAPDHFDLQPHPHPAYGEWIVSQMQRWGQLALDVDRGELARRVLRPELSAGLLPRSGFPALPESERPATPSDPRGEVTSLPFAAPLAETPPPRRYALEPEVRSHLHELLGRLAEIAGGRLDTELPISSGDEIGWLEQMIGEIVRNARFAHQALREQLRLEEEAHVKEALIAAQRELLQQLSTPIIPLLASTLLVPLIGTMDVTRAQQVAEQVLAAVTQHRARIVMLDVTGLGVSSGDGVAVADHLLRVMRAIALLGARCVLVGISPGVARTLTELGVDLSAAVAQRDLASAIDYALAQLGLAITRKATARSSPSAGRP